MRLVPFPEVLRLDESQAGEFADAINAMAQVPQSPPWCSYLALDGDVPVAMGGFKGAPVAGVVEIGYLTFEAFRGHGLATALARELVKIARREGVSRLTANTLPEDNPSTGVLRANGFRRDGTGHDEDVGETWAWALDLE